jgi:hypothetical protein
VKDTVEFGGWRRPPRWMLATIAVATAAALAGVAVPRAGHHRAGQASALTAPATPASGQQGGVRMPPHKPARMAGAPLPRGAGLRPY